MKADEKKQNEAFGEAVQETLEEKQESTAKESIQEDAKNKEAVSQENAEENEADTAQEEGEENANTGNTMVYSIRVLAAIYLIYVSYGIFKGFFDGNENITMTLLVMAIIFTILAVVFGVSGYKGLQRDWKATKKREEKNPTKGIFRQTALQKKKSISERANMVEQMEEEQEDSEEE